MPLVLMTGLPSSGKSRRAKELKDKFKEKHPERETVIVSENDFINQRPDFGDVFLAYIYAEIDNVNFNNFLVANKEKFLRGEIRSEAQRSLDRNKVVVVDAGNYLKSIRYELFCIAKTAKETFCVLYCDAVETDAWQWNLDSINRRKYSRAEFDALLNRYECPDSKNRWDSTLFILHPEEEIDISAVAVALFEKVPGKANQSTVTIHNLPSNVIADIDKITKEVTEKVIKSKGGEYDHIFSIGSVPQAKLLRVQTQFMHFLKKNPPKFLSSQEATEEIEKMFSKFLIENLKLQL